LLPDSAPPSTPELLTTTPSPPSLPALSWEILVDRLRHAGFTLMMLGFVATLGRAIWRQRRRPLEWQPDIPLLSFRPLQPLPGDSAYLAAKVTLDAIQRVQAGDLPQALADLREAYRRLPRAESAYNLARGWELAEMVDWAEIAYRTALQHDPDLREAGFNLASLLVATEKPLEALVIYRMLKQRHPEDGAIAFNHGNLLATLGMLGPACDELRRAARLLPTDAAPRANLRIVKRRKRAQLWARTLLWVRRAR
jgi:Flp pilus assembly protein TadD